jgi:hypothetical protein
MHHARSDYQERIQDAAGLIPEDEPVLLIRGQDVLAPMIARTWADGFRLVGGDPEVVQAMRNYADHIERWQDENRAKVPDVPREAIERFIP